MLQHGLRELPPPRTLLPCNRVELHNRTAAKPPAVAAPSWASDTPTWEEVVKYLLSDATVAVADPNAEPLPPLHARAFELQRPAGSSA